MTASSKWRPPTHGKKKRKGYFYAVGTRSFQQKNNQLSNLHLIFGWNSVILGLSCIGDISPAKNNHSHKSVDGFLCVCLFAMIIQTPVRATRTELVFHKSGLFLKGYFTLKCIKEGGNKKKRKKKKGVTSWMRSFPMKQPRLRLVFR